MDKFIEIKSVEVTAIKNNKGNKKIYIAGKITGLENYKELFDRAEKEFLEKGYKVMNPAALPGGFEWDEYTKICFKMIEVCDEVYFLNNWKDSKGAIVEHGHANSLGKKISYQEG